MLLMTAMATIMTAMAKAPKGTMMPASQLAIFSSERRFSNSLQSLRPSHITRPALRRQFAVRAKTARAPARGRWSSAATHALLQQKQSDDDQHDGPEP